MTKEELTVLLNGHTVESLEELGRKYVDTTYPSFKVHKYSVDCIKFGLLVLGIPLFFHPIDKRKDDSKGFQLTYTLDRIELRSGNFVDNLYTLSKKKLEKF